MQSTTRAHRRLLVGILAAVATASLGIAVRAGGPQQSFTFLQDGFTQEINAVTGERETG